MVLTIITLFPKIFDSVFSYSIIKRAQAEGKIKINVVNLRDFGIGAHKMVDGRPYGGGVGMVLRADVVGSAIKSAHRNTNKGKEKVVLLDPKGQVFNQEFAEKLSKLDHLILVCGHYEGFDERIRDLVDLEISAGDYILSGGELAAALITESVSRLVPGVLKKEEAHHYESFSKSEHGRILEHPHYTRPRVYSGKKVPETLLSGDFKRIEGYRTKKAKELTKRRRPDIKRRLRVK